MNIHENIFNYRIEIEYEDLLILGKSLDEAIRDLIEASGLVGKPLGEYRYTQDPVERKWVVIIDKEIEKSERYSRI